MNTLVIQPSRFGDLLQTLPVLKRWRDTTPVSRITVLCPREFAAPLQLSGLADRIAAVSMNRLIDVLHQPLEGPALMVALGNVHPVLAEPYAVVINLGYDADMGRLSATLDAEKRLGRVAAPEGEIRVRGDWGKYLFATADERRHNLYNYVDACIGLAQLPHAAMEACIPVSDDLRTAAERALRRQGWDGGRPLVGLQLGANKTYRAWAPEDFADLALALQQSIGARIVLLGSSGERALADRVTHLAGQFCIDLVGQTSLDGLPAVLARCDLVISNDTGPIHLAAAVGTRVLGLYFSAACFTETAPYGAGHVVMQVELPCSPCHDDQVCPDMLCRGYLTPQLVGRTARRMLDGQMPAAQDLQPQVETYASRFLSNGTLLYEPLSGAPSRLYLSALAGRMVWDGVLGLERDPSVVARLAGDDEALAALREMLSAYRAPLERLRGIYGAAGKAVARIRCALGHVPPDTAAMQRDLDDLDRLEAEIRDLPSPMGAFRTFHRLVMMDMALGGDAAGRDRMDVYRDYYRDLAQRYLALGHFATTALEGAAPHRTEPPSVPVAAGSRKARVLVVGALAGGTVPIGRAVHRALSGRQHPSRLIDFSDFAGRLQQVKDRKDPAGQAELLMQCQIRLMQAVLDFRPDVVLGLAQSPLNAPDVLERLRRAGIRLAYWFLEDGAVFDYWRQIAPCFDVFFTIQKDPLFSQLKSTGCRRVHYLPAAFDAEIGCPDVTKDRAPIAVSFMGAPYPNRVYHFSRLARPDFKVFGEGWAGLGLAAVTTGDRRIGTDEARAIYLRSRVNLNLHASGAPEGFGQGDFVNPRTFELAGLGAFQLTDRRSLLAEHFDLESEVAAFDDWQQMEAAIDHFLVHEDDRRQMARNARLRVLREHTMAHRVAEMLALLE